MERRGHQVVYLKGQEEIVELLRLSGPTAGSSTSRRAASRRDVRNRLNRLLNAEEANLGRTVQAADRQLQAIERLEREGAGAPARGLREAAAQRRRQPDADLDTLASASASAARR